MEGCRKCPWQKRLVKMWTEYTFSKRSFHPRGYPRQQKVDKKKKKEETLAYRCIREPWCRCEKKVVCMYRFVAAPVEAPLACLRYGSRAPLSDVLCRTIWIVLYTGAVPRTAGVWREKEEERERKEERKNLRGDSREGAVTTRLFLSLWTRIRWIPSRYFFTEKLCYSYWGNALDYLSI